MGKTLQGTLLEEGGGWWVKHFKGLHWRKGRGEGTVGKTFLLNSIFSTFYFRPRTIGSAATKITTILKIKFYNNKKHRKDIMQERVG